MSPTTTAELEPWLQGVLVAVDREACTFYRGARRHPAAGIFGNRLHRQQQRSPHLKKWHIDDKKEKQIARISSRAYFPKILIVTEKLLTGFDAPILYAMYLTSRCGPYFAPAIARVNGL